MSLSTTNHGRDYSGLTYIYPVISRRARGVSIGVNLNPNKACNWRCVYCQVEGLVRGKGPVIDLDLLERELGSLLEDVVHGDFMENHVPEGSRQLKDIAFSGDGESTSSPQFEESVRLVTDTMTRFDLVGKINLVLITNGSLAKQESVTRGLKAFAGAGGEIWFKLDRGSDEAIQRVNGVSLKLESHLENLVAASTLVPTWIQTCMHGVDGEPPSEAEVSDYLTALQTAAARGAKLKGVLLYGMARPPMLPEATNLTRLDASWLEELGERIRGLGLVCQVSA